MWGLLWLLDLGFDFIVDFMMVAYVGACLIFGIFGYVGTIVLCEGTLFVCLVYALDCLSLRLKYFVYSCRCLCFFLGVYCVEREMLCAYSFRFAGLLWIRCVCCLRVFVGLVVGSC